MTTLSAFKGMDNRHRAEALPPPSKDSPGYYLRNAVNVQFDVMGNARLMQGVVRRYAGSGCHSYRYGYFVEAGELKQFNSDYTATTLGTVGDNPMGYTDAGGRLFCGNGLGWEIVGGTVRKSGIDWPEQQPTLTEATLGGLYAGKYQVAVSFMRGKEESGFGQASVIDIAEGRGILVALPSAPADITKIAVYVTSVNGKDLYLYNEYRADVTEVLIDNSIFYDDEKLAIRAETQFSYPPDFGNILQAHNGRIYWAEGNALRWTEPLRYGLTKAGNYAQFKGDINLIVSLPGTLYVCADKTYKLGNIDGDGFIQRYEVLPYGSVNGAVVYDDNNTRAFWLSHQGIVTASSDGIKEYVAEVIAMPKYDQGTIALIEIDGEQQIIAVGQGGTVSRLMDSEFKASEIARKGNAL